MEKIVKEYFRDLKKYQYSEIMIENKKFVLRKFEEYLKTAGIEDFNRVNKATIENFTMSLKAGLKIETVKSYLKRVREFFKYLEIKKIVKQNPFIKKRFSVYDLQPENCDFKKYYEGYIELKTYEETCKASMAKIKQCLNLFFEYLAGKKIIKLRAIKKEDLTGFVKYLVDLKDEKGKTLYKSESVNRVLAEIKPFIQWLSKKGIYVSGFSSHIGYLRKTQELHRNILTRKELSALFNLKVNSLYEFMIKSIFVMQYATGLRINELLNITLKDIDFEKKELTIFESKTQKHRLAHTGEVGINYLKIFVNNIREKVCYDSKTSDKIFLSYIEGKRLSEATVSIYLKKFCRKLGIEKNISSHCFRHSYGTHLLENGLGIKEVSDLLGHRDLTSTEKYTRLSPERLRKTLAHCHPREKERICRN